jgi:predicted AAA+ superfamily ATPase
LPNETLIFLDEIQLNEFAIAKLKDFHEDFQNINIVCAGSLLGLHKAFMPVGNVKQINMYPLTFDEFLLNIDKQIYQYALSQYENLDESITSKIYEYYKTYLIIGGLPEPVNDFIKHGDYERIDNILSDLIERYKSDFSQYSKNIDPIKIRNIFDSIPSQLAKENVRFFINNISSTTRLERYEDAIIWLKDAGLIYQVYKLDSNKYPLIANKNDKYFKLYFFDVGILRYLSRISITSIINENKFD